MKVTDLRIGDTIRDKRTLFEMKVIGIYSSLDLDPKETTVMCDFEGNEGDVWEYEFNEIEIVNNNK